MSTIGAETTDVPASGQMGAPAPAPAQDPGADIPASGQAVSKPIVPLTADDIGGKDLLNGNLLQLTNGLGPEGVRMYQKFRSRIDSLPNISKATAQHLWDTEIYPQFDKSSHEDINTRYDKPAQDLMGQIYAPLPNQVAPAPKLSDIPKAQQEAFATYAVIKALTGGRFGVTDALRSLETPIAAAKTNLQNNQNQIRETEQLRRQGLAAQLQNLMEDKKQEELGVRENQRIYGQERVAEIRAKAGLDTVEARAANTHEEQARKALSDPNKTADDKAPYLRWLIDNQKATPEDYAAGHKDGVGALGKVEQTSDREQRRTQQKEMFPLLKEKLRAGNTAAADIHNQRLYRLNKLMPEQLKDDEARRRWIDKRTRNMPLEGAKRDGNFVRGVDGQIIYGANGKPESISTAIAAAKDQKAVATDDLLKVKEELAATGMTQEEIVSLAGRVRSMRGAGLDDDVIKGVFKSLGILGHVPEDALDKLMAAQKELDYWDAQIGALSGQQLGGRAPAGRKLRRLGEDAVPVEWGPNGGIPSGPRKTKSGITFQFEPDK